MAELELQTIPTGIKFLLFFFLLTVETNRTTTKYWWNVLLIVNYTQKFSLLIVKEIVTFFDVITAFREIS